MFDKLSIFVKDLPIRCFYHKFELLTFWRWRLRLLMEIMKRTLVLLMELGRMFSLPTRNHLLFHRWVSLCSASRLKTTYTCYEVQVACLWYWAIESPNSGRCFYCFRSSGLLVRTFFFRPRFFKTLNRCFHFYGDF